MIEIAKLEKMVRMEVAADSWWHDLSKKEQQAYIKAHPGSKFAKSHKLAGGNAKAKQTAYHAAMTDSHAAASDWHEKMAKRHSKLSGAEGDRHSVAAAKHRLASGFHENARAAHSDALHMDNGNVPQFHTHQARKASRLALRHSSKAGVTADLPKTSNIVADGKKVNKKAPNRVNNVEERKRHERLADLHVKAARLAEKTPGNEGRADKHWSAAGFHRSAAEHHDQAHQYGKRGGVDGTEGRNKSHYDKHMRTALKHAKRADSMSSKLGTK